VVTSLIQESLRFRLTYVLGRSGKFTRPSSLTIGTSLTSGNYVLALKDNHEKLLAEVDEAFTAALEARARPAGMARHVTTETNCGRSERREYTVLPVPASLGGTADWQDLKTLAKLICQHWSIESRLHCLLDVTFSEDKGRIRTQHAPQTLALLRRLAVSILSADTTLKDSIRGELRVSQYSRSPQDHLNCDSRNLCKPIGPVRNRPPWAWLPRRAMADPDS